MKNPSTLLYEKFSLVTIAKGIMENINRCRSYKPLSDGHFTKNAFEILAN